jgi:hypothetical protein
VPLGLTPPALTLFLADHHLHKSTNMLIWIGDGKVQIFCIISFSNLLGSNNLRYSSRLIILQHSFFCLHLRNKWSQSASNLLHIGQIVSSFIPRLAKFRRSARLLCWGKHWLGSTSYFRYEHIGEWMFVLAYWFNFDSTYISFVAINCILFNITMVKVQFWDPAKIKHS